MRYLHELREGDTDCPLYPRYAALNKYKVRMLELNLVDIARIIVSSLDKNL